MKLYIGLSIYNGTGSVATLETKDGDEITIAGSRNTGSKKACRDAAKALREAAARFELLAEEDEPHKAVTHARVNKAKLYRPNVTGKPTHAAHHET